MAYRIEFNSHAAQAFRKPPRDVQKRLVPAIDALQETPRPPGAVKISGTARAYRIRIGTYRILYEIHDARLLVLVIDVGHRRDIYG